MSNVLAQFSKTSLLLLIFVLTGLCLATFLGKKLWNRRQATSTQADDELKIVLGAVLSLFGLLIGFLLTIAISGYNSRIQAEENEAVAIGNAFQRTSLLNDEHQIIAENLLQEYLSLRIAFYEADDQVSRDKSRLQSIQLQTKMWLMISNVAKKKPDPVIATVLNACNDLYTAQQRTLSNWRAQVPLLAWVLLMLFALCSNFLIGYNIRGVRGNNALLLTLPILTTLALFMIAEIDAPGEGIIHVTPDNLQAVRVTVAKGGLAP